MSTSPERVRRVLKAPRHPVVPLHFPAVETLPAVRPVSPDAEAAGQWDDPDHVRQEAAARGYAEGYAAGAAEGLAAGRAEARAHAAGLLGRLEAQLAAQADHERHRAEELASSASAFAFEVVEVLLGRELALAEAPGRDAVRRALQMAPASGGGLVRLHPDDVEDLGDLRPVTGGGRSLDVVADPAVERGGCVLVVGDTTVDAQLGTALARLREVLAP